MLQKFDWFCLNIVDTSIVLAHECSCFFLSTRSLFAFYSLRGWLCQFQFCKLRHRMCRFPDLSMVFFLLKAIFPRDILSPTSRNPNSIEWAFTESDRQFKLTGGFEFHLIRYLLASSRKTRLWFSLFHNFQYNWNSATVISILLARKTFSLENMGRQMDDPSSISESICGKYLHSKYLKVPKDHFLLWSE